MILESWLDLRQPERVLYTLKTPERLHAIARKVVAQFRLLIALYGQRVGVAIDHYLQASKSIPEWHEVVKNILVRHWDRYLVLVRQHGMLKICVQGMLVFHFVPCFIYTLVDIGRLKREREDRYGTPKDMAAFARMNDYQIDPDDISRFESNDSPEIKKLEQYAAMLDFKLVFRRRTGSIH